MEDTNSFSMNAMPLAAFNAFWTWADFGFGAAIDILDYQRRLWQPWIDFQSTLLQRSHEGIGVSDPASWMIRGIEQLG